MQTPTGNPPQLAKLLEHPDLWRGRDRKERRHCPATGFPELDRHLPGGGWPRGALTEILCEQDGLGELSLLLPALTRLSQGDPGPGDESPDKQRWIALIAPPYLPYAPAFKAQGIDLSRILLVFPPPPSPTGPEPAVEPTPESSAQPVDAAVVCWAIEQALRSGTCAAVLAWPRRIAERKLRRLQLAAEEGRSWGVLFRGADSAREASPAALRLRIRFADTRAPDSRIIVTGDGRPGETEASEASSAPLREPVVEVFKCRGGRAFGPIKLPPLYA